MIRTKSIKFQQQLHLRLYYYIIQVSISNMGCTAARDQVYVAKEPQFSNREVNQSKNELEDAQHELFPYACGYSFEIGEENAKFEFTGDCKKIREEEERENFSIFMETYKEMQKCYQTSKIDQAYALEQKIKQVYQQLNFNLIPELQRVNKREMLELGEEIESSYLQLITLEKQLSGLEWSSLAKENGLNVKYAQNKGDTRECIETQDNIGLELVVATFASFARYDQFMKFAVNSRQMKKMSSFRRLGEVSYDFPFCCKNVSYFESVVYDRLQHNNSVFVSYQSLYKNTKLWDRLQFFPIFNSEHQIDFTSIVCILEPLSQNQTKIQLFFNIKGEIQRIAGWVLEKMYKNMAMASCKKLMERAKAYGEDTTNEAFQGDDEIYHHFHSLLNRRQLKPI